MTAAPPKIKYWTPLLVLCSVAFPIGVLWNGYVIFVTGCRVERTASAMWFLNRAVSDLIFIPCLPLRFNFIFSMHGDWARRLSSTITSLHMFSSAFLLTAISVHRCILTAQPEWAQKCCTASLACWVSLGIWALSAGFSLRYGDLWESLLPPANTSLNFSLDEGRVKVAIIIQFLAGFLIPLALILISIFYVLQAARLGRNRLIQAKQLLKILLGLIPTFFLCWLPYRVFYFLWISAAHSACSGNRKHICLCVLTYVNSCLNPIFYLTMEEEFLRYLECTHNPDTTDHTGLEPAD
ncbi:LOW QUALITY PROTEIN: chemerin-like receptor 1 [Pelodiscus sinensis]|uniref:LOW QUALITY PROTEIN: chemerin-like receptor 1 n=1 Tax=Pelodiscus sinensis TaxID=13735 RepID=UPI003F6DA2F2